MYHVYEFMIGRRSLSGGGAFSGGAAPHSYRQMPGVIIGYVERCREPRLYTALEAQACDEAVMGAYREVFVDSHGCGVVSVAARCSVLP